MPKLLFLCHRILINSTDFDKIIMKKVLITLPLSEKRLTAINQHIPADCLSGEKDLYEEVAERIPNYEALLFLGPMKPGIDAPLLAKANKLKIISNYGVGYDRIDADAAKANQVIVANTPHSVTAPTADLALGLMLSICRRIGVSDRAIRQKTTTNWYNSQLPSTTLKGKKLGIVGMGRIGKAVAERAKVFGIEIFYFQRNQLAKAVEEKYQATYLPLHDLLKTVDILSPHIPLTPSTRHLFGAKELALLKPTAFIINTARGGVFDESALIEILQNGKIAGAGLDVFANEPTVPDAFLAMDNVLLTPHIGTACGEARADMFEEAIGNLIAYFNGQKITNRVI